MLLQSYLESCRRVEQLNMDAQDLNQRWDSARRNVWLTENVVLKEQVNHHSMIDIRETDGRCTLQGHCGEGRLAAGTYTIQRTKFQQPCFEEVKNLAQKRRNLRVVQLAFAAHQSKTAELQCKHYICSALRNYRTATGISAFSPSFSMFLSLHAVPFLHSLLLLVRFDEPPQSLIPARRKILNCITVLFHFLRQPAVETVFNQSCRSWLNDLVRLCCFWYHLIQEPRAIVFSAATCFGIPLSMIISSYYRTYCVVQTVSAFGLPDTFNRFAI